MLSLLEKIRTDLARFSKEKGPFGPFSSLFS
jgi:hypothetical protein